MLTQQLSADLGDNSGVLTVRAPAQGLAELQTLAEELSARENIRTNGPIIHVPPDPVPPPPEPV
jgi:hypothetical protein